ncbi:hypothetical protein ACHQM5_028307 [Ranunculus cassubicifolius]
MMKLGWFLVNLLLIVVFNSRVSATGGVFDVQHKFAGQQPSLSAIKDHDLHRHQRLLYAVDLPLGGDGKATGTGLYYTKIKIGSPSKDYYVHVDTGSDLFWINCIRCTQCPITSTLGVNLTLYNPSSSVNSELIKCDNDFCTSNGTSPHPGCVPASAVNCVYRVAYGDGSSSTGYFVKDLIQYDRVSGNLETAPTNSSVVFGCGVQQSGNLNNTESALDGILGFGQSEISMLSQIAGTGSIKKVFAHCFDGDNGGGIFAMGNVVQPVVKTTPLVQNKTHYNVKLETIAVGNETLQLPVGTLGTVNGTDTIIDSGTTLAYFPDAIYKALVTKIMANHGDLKVKIFQGHFQCFAYSTSLDDGFPTVTLNFENSLELVVPPRDYLFQLKANAYCIGWQSNGNISSDDSSMAILGDLVLSNKFVLYNLENQTIGWTDYNCSSTIGVQDEESNAIYQVGKLMAR